MSKFRNAVNIAASIALLAGAVPAAEAQSGAVKRGERTDNTFYRSPSSLHGKTVVIPVGATWEGRIDKTISSAKSHGGEQFNVILSSPVLLNGSDVIVPAGSVIQGEVVEAMSSGRVPKRPGQPKEAIRGKLRVQLTSLRTPDGVTYPLVASLAPDNIDKRRGGGGDPRNRLGQGMAYVGSAASFEAVHPSVAANSGMRKRAGEAPKVIGKQEFMRDHILGLGDNYLSAQPHSATVRSLLLKGRDYYIYSGSPLTIRIEAPFKIALNPPEIGGPIGDSIDQEPVVEEPRGKRKKESVKEDEPLSTVDSVGSGNLRGGRQDDVEVPASPRREQTIPSTQNGPPSADSF